MDALDRIFSLPHLSRLEMRINRPNPDTGDDELEKEVFERLNNQNADREEIKLTATPGKSLRPDDSTTSLARIAQNNGYVKASGHDENRTHTEESTEKHPWTELAPYNPNLTTAADALREKAREMWQKIKDRLRST
uniref:Uncharacterized protein n=1 Tax=Candidatus Kentrum sp. LFY TaxID=2126342 RepID=A0A450WWH0_9GAMM|nr:MAG: protein of unknown function (DUF4747) [Candidatus Kentron sp. LFY]